MLIRVLLLSGGLGICAPANISISHAADKVVKLDKTDKKFLKHPIGYDITFPATSKAPLKNEAAKFLNNAFKKKPKNYQTLLNALVAKDKQMSNQQHNTTIPGSFLNSAADLYANIDIDTSSFRNASSTNKTAAKIKGEQELLKFAALLQKEAKIINQPSSHLADRLNALEKALAEAKAQGTLPPKVYVYSDSLAEKPYYIEIVRRYYHHHGEVLVYHVVPAVYDPAYITVLTSAAAGFGLGLVFFSRLPRSYPPFWSHVWHPFFHAFRGKAYADWGGKNYNITNYVHQQFAADYPRHTTAHATHKRQATKVHAAHSNAALAHSSRAHAVPKHANRHQHKAHTTPPPHIQSNKKSSHHHGAAAHAQPHHSNKSRGSHHY